MKTETDARTSDIGYDLEKAKRLASSYARATDIGCTAIDATGATLFQSGSMATCAACRCGSSVLRPRFSCADVHLYGTYQAERFGGQYIFFCPLGLTHWASPITEGDAVRGALIGGPVLMVSPEEFIIDDVLDHGIVEATREQFTAFIHTIPVRRPEEVKALSELLFVLAGDVSAGRDLRREQQNRLIGMQAQIAEAVQSIKQQTGTQPASALYPIEKERELLRLIARGDKAESQRVLNEILGYVFFSTGNDFTQIKSRALELVVLLSRAAIEGGADPAEIFGLNMRYLSEAGAINNAETLTGWLSTILARFTNCVFELSDVRHRDIIYKAPDYIRRNYMNRITLDDVARLVYLNSTYFSKVFREEMGCTFVVYVNRLRVEVACELLKSSAVPLTDVSSLAGFEEQSYFTRVFKKVTGMTPGQYRSTRGMGGAAKSNAENPGPV